MTCLPDCELNCYLSLMKLRNSYYPECKIRRAMKFCEREGFNIPYFTENSDSEAERKELAAYSIKLKNTLEYLESWDHQPQYTLYTVVPVDRQLALVGPSAPAGSSAPEPESVRPSALPAQNSFCRLLLNLMGW